MKHSLIWWSEVLPFVSTADAVASLCVWAGASERQFLSLDVSHDGAPHGAACHRPQGSELASLPLSREGICLVELSAERPPQPWQHRKQLSKTALQGQAAPEKAHQDPLCCKQRGGYTLSTDASRGWLGLLCSDHMIPVWREGADDSASGPRRPTVRDLTTETA